MPRRGWKFPEISAPSSGNFSELGIAGVWNEGFEISGNFRKFPEIPSSGNFYQISRATIAPQSGNGME